MTTITLRLPWPPSTNAIWRSRISGTGRKQFVTVYLSAEGKQYFIDVQAAVLEKYGFMKPTADRLRLTMLVVAPNKRKIDISNRIKILEDSLVHAKVMVDDEQIDELIVRRGPITKPGWIDVELSAIPAAA